MENLEERLAMSANPIAPELGQAVEHHGLINDAPPLEHHQEATPDFWIDYNLLSNPNDFEQEIEQALYEAHNQTGLDNVRNNYGFTGGGQTVAVIDSGIAYDHFALGGGLGSNYRVVGGWDFTENDADPYDDGPEGSHGTHVAGIVGGDSGNDNGVAPDVDLVGLRVFDDAGNGFFSWVEDALQWVHTNRNSFENPITAVNLSLGATGWNSESIPAWAQLEDEFAQLKADGIFISVSAGNSFASYNTPGLSYPAASPHVVPVMSVDDSGLLSHFSQRSSRGIAAPGRWITSTVPDYAGNNNGLADDYATFSGTSMAAPYVAGASVIIREAMEFVGYTNITQDTIFDHIKATAESFYDSATDAWYDRLDLDAAIDALMPADEFGSTMGTAHSLGTISSTASANGAIATLGDADYFTFTAGVTGTVSFAASTTHDLTASWDSSAAGWTSGGGDTYSLNVNAGETYTVGLSSSGGLGYFDINITAESTFTYTDWGSITQNLFSNLSNSGDTWYRVQAGYSGYLTTEALFNSGAGNVSLELYDANMTQVASSVAVAGGQRVDHVGGIGEQYFLKVTGTNADIDFRLTNRVGVSGLSAVVLGTTGDDEFTLTAGANHLFSINGVEYSLNSNSVTQIDFVGGGGNDSVIMTGTAGDESATLFDSSVTLSGDGFTATGAGIENIVVHSGGGSDTARLYDTGGDDLFKSFHDRSIMSGNGYFNRVIGFQTALGYSSQGNDIAYVYDGAGNDVYTAYSDRVVMEGDGVFRRASGFSTALAFSDHGNDIAYFYDTAGNDNYFAVADFVYMEGAGFFNRATGFEATIAQSTSGLDTAYLYDSAGDDTYWSYDNRAIMSGQGYHNNVTGFQQTFAFSQGGSDTAYMFDSAGDDTYWSYSDRVIMSGSSFFHRASNFDVTLAFSYSGNDVAYMFDSAGDDDYRAYPDRVVMSGTGFYNKATGFGTSLAFSTGGNDTAYMYDSSGNDAYFVYSDRVVMSGGGYLNKAAGFGSTHGVASSGNDDVYLYDSAGNDDLEVRDYAISLTSGGLNQTADGFDYAELNSVTGGHDTADVLVTDYAFDLIGAWV